MLTVQVVLAVIAIILTAISAAGKCPLWPPVFVLCLIALIAALPS